MTSDQDIKNKFDNLKEQFNNNDKEKITSCINFINNLQHNFYIYCDDYRLFIDGFDQYKAECLLSIYIKHLLISTYDCSFRSFLINNKTYDYKYINLVENYLIGKKMLDKKILYFIKELHI